MLLELFECKDAKVQFFIGGTSANLTMISMLLKHSYEAVIATKQSHIANHEGGAIEGCGHRILIAEDYKGKICADSIERICIEHMNDRHMVLPKLVYISNTTEVGTVYSLEELEQISKVCKKYDLYFYMDGARLFSARYSLFNDIHFKDYAKYLDAFYVGGTKAGLMLGEAAIIVNKDLQKDYLRHMKNKGAMLAKGSLIGLNFQALLTDEFYKRVAINCNEKAMSVAAFLETKGHEFMVRPESNQVFVLMRDNEVETLSQYYDFADLGYENKDSKRKCIRLVTSFSTTQKDVDEFMETYNRKSNFSKQVSRRERVVCS